MQQPLADAATITRTSSPRMGFDRQVSTSSSDAEDSSGSGASSPASDDGLERVINVKSCPLCHRPRMNAKAEVDIVTHLAVCASQDWARVDRIVVGNFVTASQAQRSLYRRRVRYLLDLDGCRCSRGRSPAPVGSNRCLHVLNDDSGILAHAERNFEKACRKRPHTDRYSAGDEGDDF